MINVVALDQRICEAYTEGEPAIETGESEKGKWTSFRVANRQYDPHSERKTHWSNMTVKAFGVVVDRIVKMGIDAGSYVHIIGEEVEEFWPDKKNEGKMKYRRVFIARDVLFAGSNGKGKKQDEAKAPEEEKPSAEPEPEAENQTAEGTFTGAEAFDQNPENLFSDTM